MSPHLVITVHVIEHILQPIEPHLVQYHLLRQITRKHELSCAVEVEDAFEHFPVSVYKVFFVPGAVNM